MKPISFMPWYSSSDIFGECMRNWSAKMPATMHDLAPEAPGASLEKIAHRRSPPE